MSDVHDNPLLGEHEAVPFREVSAEHLEPAITALLTEAEAAIEAVRRTQDLTFNTTLGALEYATERLSNTFALVGFLRAVTYTDDLAAAYAAITPRVVGFYAGLATDADLYRVIQAYAETDEARTLNPEKARLLERTLDEFRRSGAALDAPERQRLSELHTELAERANQFSVNAMRSAASWSLEVSEDALEGVPESTRELLRAAAEDGGKTGYLITLQATIVTGLLKHARDVDLRERVWRAWYRRATEPEHDNAPIVQQMIALRRELAGVLGYDDFADFVLEDRMARTGATARTFLDDLTRAARGPFATEIAELQERKKQDLDGPLEGWDVNYYTERLQQERLQLDEETLRPWFSLDHVLDGLFELVKRLYDVHVVETKQPVWHDSVRAWELRDSAERVLGTFYTDFSPRQSKRDGAWMAPLRTGGPTDGGGWLPAMGAICGNLTPPVGGGPALLTHREVQTIFHEFGHLLHHLLSEVSLPSLAGTNVAWDFVELPSQIMENWCWEREALDLFAVHVHTGKPLPEALLSQLKATRTFMGASYLMRQLSFGHADLDLHTRYDPERDGDVVHYAREAMAAYAPTRFPDDFAMITSFSHLFGSPTGYAAGYYSYLWAAVLDADAFGRFRDAGGLDHKTGMAFRAQILSRGNAEPPEKLFEQFMGRGPDPRAMLQRLGIEPTAP